jgi:uncharacterized protein YciI
MSFLVVLRPARAEMPFEPTEEEERVVSEHFQRLLRLLDEGTVAHAGLSPVEGDSIGIVVFDLDDEDEVRTLVADDPAVASGAMTAEIRPFRIATR